MRIKFCISLLSADAEKMRHQQKCTTIKKSLILFLMRMNGDVYLCRAPLQGRVELVNWELHILSLTEKHFWQKNIV